MHIEFFRKTKKVSIIVFSLFLIGITAIFVFYPRFINGKRSHEAIRKQIDSLISWSNDTYTQKQEEAFAIIELSKSLAIETARPEIIGNVFNKEASFLKGLNHYSKSILAYNQAAKLYLKSNQLDKLASAYFNLADIFKIIGEYSKSMDYCGKSLELYKKLKDKDGIKRCYRILGSDYKYTKDYDRSLLYYQKSLTICEEEGDSEEIAIALNNLGTAYGAMGNDSIALKYYEQCYDVYRRNNNINGLSIYFNNTGSIYTNAKDYEKARRNLKLALKYRRQTNDKRRESLVLENIGNYFFQTNELDSSIIYYTQSLDIALKYGLKERLFNCYLALSKIYLKVGKPYDAYHELEHYNHIKDTIFATQKSIDMVKMEANFDYYKEQLVDSSNKQKQNLLTIIYILSILIFSFGFIYIIKRFQKSIIQQQEFNQVLVDEKCKIEEDLSEKNKELVSYSLQLAQKQEIDKALADRIKAEIKCSSGETKKKFENILTNLILDSQRVNIWDDFELRFNQVNQDFYVNLQEKFPALTQNERRLCAFLKLNLCTKEITLITGQSPHSINVARTRLRKKLNLANSNQNLFDFFQSL